MQPARLGPKGIADCTLHMASQVSIQKRRVVLGLGNILCGDEGLGVFALHTARDQLGNQSGFEWIDGGVMGLDLLPLVEECSHLLVLDAIDADQPAGTVIELEKKEISLLAGIKLSEHQLSFKEVLGLASIQQALPEQLHLIGIQPSDLTVKIGLSEIVKSAMPEMIEHTRRVLSEWV